MKIDPEVGGDVERGREQAAAVVALVEKEADGVAFAETHLVADAVLPDLEAFGRGGAGDKLWGRLGGGGTADLAGEDFVINAACVENFGEPRQFLLLRGAQNGFGLGEQVVAELFNVPARPAVARAVNQAAGVRRVRLDDGGAQAEARVGVEIGGRAKPHRLAAKGMGEGNFRRVQEDARGCGAAIQGVAKNRKAALGRVDADLVRASGERVSFHGSESRHWPRQAA